MSGDQSWTPESSALHRLTVVEVPHAVEVLARSFDQDPFVNWLARADARHAESVRRWFTTCIRDFTLPFNEVWATKHLDAVALWTPPGKFHVSVAEQVRLLWQAVLGFGIRNVASRLSALNEIQRHDPTTPYYYLFFLGVEPSQQCKGIGSRMMEHMLDRCDGEEKPAYLQATRLDLIPFYARYGFVQLESVPVRHGGPMLYPMWREPAGKGC